MVKVFHIRPGNEKAMPEMNNAIAKKLPVLSAIYMPGCGYCEELIPKWNMAANQVSSSYSGDAIIALIHMDSIGGINIPKNNIRGYPHVSGYVNAVEEEYNGDRSESDIMRFMIQTGGLTNMSMGGARKKRKLTSRRNRRPTRRRPSRRRRSRRSKRH